MRVYKSNIVDDIISMYHEYLIKRGEKPNVIEMTKSDFNILRGEMKKTPGEQLTHANGMKIVIVEEKPQSPKR